MSEGLPVNRVGIVAVTKNQINILNTMFYLNALSYSPYYEISNQVKMNNKYPERVRLDNYIGTIQFTQTHFSSQ